MNGETFPKGSKVGRACLRLSIDDIEFYGSLRVQSFSVGGHRGLTDWILLSILPSHILLMTISSNSGLLRSLSTKVANYM